MAPDKPAVEREPQPARERRALSFEATEARASGKPGEGLIFKGHAAVFDRLSLDLGGFREKIAPGAFARALDGSPDVHLVWDHNGEKTLARTSGKYLLELREDPRGLHFYANAAPTSYAKDLAVLMEGGTIDQGSFAFTVANGGDTWEVDEAGDVTRTIHEVDALYDVTITRQGAYPQTDTAVVMRSLDAFRAEHTEIPSTTTELESDDSEPQQRDVAEAEPPGTESSLEEADGSPEGEEERVTEFAAVRASTLARMEAAVDEARRRLPKADRK